MNSSKLSKDIKLFCLRMIYESNASHIGSALSIADILSVLYADIMQTFPENPNHPNRDRFILSKGHAASILYALLGELKYFDNLDNIPYDSKGQKSQNEVRDFLITLLKIFIALFIFGGIVSYFLSNYITKSLQKIVLKIKGIQLNQLDEKLHWDKNDEIGVLVDAYNSMIEKLKISTEKLAKSERQSAWREMAKQVAHEIKNPLTPMKLSVQHLERSLAKEPDKSDQKIHDFKIKMIQQIDLLSNIATEFSNFAELPKANFQEVDVLKIVSSTVSLFKNNSCEIYIKCEQDSKFISIGDEHQLIRVFNNLIKNSIQSFNKEGTITIRLLIRNGLISIEFEDNGMGIPKENKIKIFEPNFTTKSNGKGLGLAMVDQIIKLHNGNIELRSSSKKGTCFLIQLPLIDRNE